MTRIVNELLDVIFGTRRSHIHTNIFYVIVLYNLTVTNVAMLRILEVIPDKIYLDKSVLMSSRKQYQIIIIIIQSNSYLLKR